MKKTQLLTLFIVISTFSTLFAQNNALHFDGNDDNVEVFTNINIPISNTIYTIEAWIKPSGLSTSSGAQGIIGWGEYLTNNATNAFRLGNNDRLINYWWANDLTATFVFNNGSWYHVAVTYDGTTRTIYINGNIINSDIPTSPRNTVSSNNLTIGLTAPIPGYNEYFNGTIDELRIWNVSLTQSEIQASRFIELTGNEVGLVSYYNFNQGIANQDNSAITTLDDISPSNNDGNLKNFTLNGNTSNWVQGVDFSLLSLDEFNKDSYYEISPNPTNETIKISNLKSKKNYRIYNALGAEIQSGVISDNEQIDVRDFNNGMYLLKFDNGTTIKFIKE